MKRVILLAALTLAACNENEAKAPPPPADLTEQALSYFCQMNVAEHGGPKGQIHLEGHDSPLFFAQVRDMVAYLKSPEREAEITAIYVSNMTTARSWADPGNGNWIAAQDAIYVVGADVAGGMGAPEIVPFADDESAGVFIAQYGGETHMLDTIPDDAALGAVDLNKTLETPS
ncbi:nitrous oxide reductase accessory protein NosL [Aliiroseovarius sp. S1339]|uniref:nitrous oxide reductase accessory protein NosL n=1 Tax=Aliiroseovarius sp. S1339 TaxID=2936990 RepID=UPI0020BDE430|nr:nitrous oxide reductase accessory protein NosL [Aliiroseovarius sp. S1339]MCK8465162.1 nitrous oxide reductase accessory protein NosL [Aliiroseovarius sp. S1339]